MKRRPKVLQGITYEMQTGCGSLHITINDKDGSPYELLTRMAKSGTCASCMTEAISRTISLGMQSGVELKSIIKNLSGISCPSPSGLDDDKVFSCADGISKAIKIHVERQKDDQK